jgi:hypothetical protein
MDGATLSPAHAPSANTSTPPTLLIGYVVRRFPKSILTDPFIAPTQLGLGHGRLKDQIQKMRRSFHTGTGLE